MVICLEITSGFLQQLHSNGTGSSCTATAPAAAAQQRHRQQLHNCYINIA
jgi:hypothetical protein